MRDYAVRSHTGYRRNLNEDCYRADHDLGLWLIADGMGGHESGEVAAAMAAQLTHERVAAGGSVAEAAAQCHLAILREIEKRGSARGMGTTLLTLQMSGNDYTLTWVGDSRAYRFADGTLQLLTWDHSPVGEMLARGEIDEEAAHRHPERHLLSRALGVSSRVEPKPDTVRGTLQPGQRLLLCSDGLSDYVPLSRMQAHMAAHSDPGQQADALLDAALLAGGRDNITVIVMGDEGDPVPHVPEAGHDTAASPQGPPLLVVICAGAIITAAAIAALLLL